MNLNKYIDTFIPTLNGKTFIVTGANSGIGFEMSKILLEKGANVIFACRNKDRALKAINCLNEDEKNRSLYLHLDMADFASIDRFITQISVNFPYFDGIILNAGVLKPKRESYTKDGFRCVVGTNFLGTMYLIKRLENNEDIKNKKIVLQSSLMARIGTYKKADLIKANSKKFHAYNISKMGIDLLFDELRNDENRKHQYFLAEPGACYSNIYGSFPKIILPLANGFMRLVFHSAKKGGLSALSLLINNYENGTILLPRGPFAFSGYPKKGKLSKKLKKSHNIMCDAYELINDYL